MTQALDNPAAIRLLMDSFYAQVTTDPLLAPFFAHLNMEEHMPRMYAFWESLLLGAGTYRGNAMQPHLELHRRLRMEPQHFERWLTLFEATLATHFSGTIAEEALSRARHIAALMQHKISQL
ncbi:MAG: group III truncated hemoglobin [Bacteroidetes bacterium]|nr:group III truncated hemoglobin [Bacteroidota bacterium]